MVLAQSRAPDPKFAFLHKQGGSGLAQPRLDGVLSHRVDEAILAAPREWDGGRGKSGGECRAAGRASVGDNPTRYHGNADGVGGNSEGRIRNWRFCRGRRGPGWRSRGQNTGPACC